MRKALFLDRDGVINEDTGYVHKSEKIVLIKGVINFLQKAQRKGYLIIVITNQSGIGRGIFTDQDYHDFMRALQIRLNARKCYIHADYYCPHLPQDKCDCRKPKPGLINMAVKRWNIDLSKSVLIGDKATDLEAGMAAGVRKINLFTGEWPEI